MAHVLRAAGKRLLTNWPFLFERTAAYVKARDIRRERWVEPELTLISRTVGPGDTAIDGGANYGLWSYHLAAAVSPTGCVLAFEPIASTARILRDVLGRLGVAGVVSVCACGLSDRHDEVEFSVPVARTTGVAVPGLAHVAQPGLHDNRLTVRAEVVRLDDWPIRGHVALLKLDIEGGELAALRGAVDVITEHRPVVICETGLEGRYGHTASDVMTFMRGHGYYPYEYQGGALAPLGDASTVLNIVFLRRDWHDAPDG